MKTYLISILYCLKRLSNLKFHPQLEMFKYFSRSNWTIIYHWCFSTFICKVVIRQSYGSCHVVIWQSSGSHMAVFRQTPNMYKRFIKVQNISIFFLRPQLLSWIRKYGIYSSIHNLIWSFFQPNKLFRKTELRWRMNQKVKNTLPFRRIRSHVF